MAAPNAPFSSDPRIVETPALRDRSMRRPKHHWAVRSRPYRLTPICIAPMMAGDTLKTMTYQGRAITDPLHNRLVGWHLEYYWFFVKIIDMRDGQAIIADLIDETQPPISADSAVSDRYFAYGTDYLTRAMELIVPHYFRDFGEVSMPETLANMVPIEGGLPIVEVKENLWWQNYTANAAMPADEVDAEDFENLWSKWQVLSRNRLTTATYEEFLRQQGVVPPANLREPDWDLKIPELVRHYRDWQFPVATIVPDSGAASSAVSWVIGDRAQRARRFTEPGFLIGLVVTRPKTYLPTVVGSSGTATSIFQAGYASGALNTAKSWVPPVYTNEPGESLRKFTELTGPLGQADLDPSEDYWIDHRDLYLNGDQFVLNPEPGSVMPRRAVGADGTSWNMHRYPTEAGISALFVGEAPAGLVSHEGVATLHVAGRVRSTTR